jgi:hypothetical protein
MIKTKRALELGQKIRELESQYQYVNQMISLLMAEGNLIDLQIEKFGQSGLSVRAKLKDLQAELKDTI